MLNPINYNNLRPIQGVKFDGQGDDHNNLCTFIDGAHSCRAFYMTMHAYITKHACDTLKKIIFRYAPAEDGNDPVKYLEAVCAETGIGEDEIFIPSARNLINLCKGSAIEENGAHMAASIPEQDYLTGLDLFEQAVPNWVK